MDSSLDATALEELRRAGGDALMLQMIESFLDAAPPRLEQAHAGVRDGDGEMIRFALHALATSAATIGAIELNELSQRGQVLVWENDQEELIRIVEDLASSYELAARELRDILEQGSNG